VCRNRQDLKGSLSHESIIGGYGKGKEVKLVKDVPYLIRSQIDISQHTKYSLGGFHFN